MEYEAAGKDVEEAEDKPEKAAKREILEKSEGAEALLGSVSTYSSHTQAVFLIPVILVFIILFAKETQIP